MNQDTNSSRWRDRLEAFFVDGSDTRRGLYERYRRLRNIRRVAQRRRAVEHLAQAANFTIPQDKGFAIFDGGLVPEINAIVYEANHELHKLDPTRVIQPEVGTAGLFMGLLDCNRLTLDSPYLKFALRPDIVAAAAQYLGIMPVLARIDLWYSAYQSQWNRTHYYHCDWTAITQVKVFVNCTDVESDNGPLTIVEAAKSRQIRRMLKYNYDRQGSRYYVSDARMTEFGADQYEHRFTGPAGTTYLVDSSRCFHYGSRMTKGAQPRSVVLFQYLRPSAFRLPLRSTAGAPFRKMAHDGLPSWQQLVLGAE